MADHPLEEILHPRSIAVVGASAGGRGGRFITPLKNLGFEGEIYPVNPKYSEIMGMQAFARVTDIPGPVDFVISSIPASGVPGLIDDCVEKGVKAVHLYTARFSETGREDAAELEQDVLRRARKGGVRLIGPNCLGVYHPGEGIAFSDDMPAESGYMGLASQSGQAVGEIVGHAAMRGIRFSKAVSYGNALDFNECDYLDYFAQDPQTKMIMMYIEGVRDGRRFLSSLKRATEEKPVLILKGGRGDAGSRATASHTASMAGSRQLWQSMIDQTGAVSATEIEDLVDTAVAFYFLPQFTGRRVGVTGGSGGSSVMAADLCEEAGLDVVPLPDAIRKELRQSGSPIWDWIGNPADFSIAMGDRSDSFRVTQMMAKHPDFDLLVVFVHGPWHRSSKPFSIDEHMRMYALQSFGNKPVVLVFGDRHRARGSEAEELGRINEEIRQRLIAENMPVFPTIGRAARAVSRMIEYYRRKPCSLRVT